MENLEAPKAPIGRQKSRSRSREALKAQLNLTERIKKRVVDDLKEARKINADLVMDVQFLRDELKRCQYKYDDALAEVERLRKLLQLRKGPDSLQQKKKKQAKSQVQEKEQTDVAATAGPSSQNKESATLEKVQETMETLLKVMQTMSMETAGSNAVAKSLAELKEEILRKNKEEDRIRQLLAPKFNQTSSGSSVQDVTPPESPASQATTPLIKTSPARSNASSATPKRKMRQTRSPSPPPGSFYTSIFGPLPATPRPPTNLLHAPMTWVTPHWGRHSFWNTDPDVQCLGIFPGSRKPRPAGIMPPPDKKMKCSDIVGMSPPETATRDLNQKAVTPASTQDQPITPDSQAQPGPSRLCMPVNDDLMKMPILPLQTDQLGRRASDSSGTTSGSFPMPTLTPQLSPNAVVARGDADLPPLN